MQLLEEPWGALKLFRVVLFLTKFHLPEYRSDYGTNPNHIRLRESDMYENHREQLDTVSDWGHRHSDLCSFGVFHESATLCHLFGESS